MTTFTASFLSQNVNTNPTGVQVMSSVINEVSVTGTAGSVFLLGRIPNGATIVDWHMYVTTGGNQQQIEIGTSATPCGIASAFSLSATFTAKLAAHNSSTSASLTALDFPNTKEFTDHRAPKGDRLPVRISLSDDVIPQSVMLQARNIIAISATAAMTFSVFYTMDGLTGRRKIR